MGNTAEIKLTGSWQCSCVYNGIRATHFTGTYCGRCGGNYAPGLNLVESSGKVIPTNMDMISGSDGHHLAVESGKRVYQKYCELWATTFVEWNELSPAYQSIWLTIANAASTGDNL